MIEDAHPELLKAIARARTLQGCKRLVPPPRPAPALPAPKPVLSPREKLIKLSRGYLGLPAPPPKCPPIELITEAVMEHYGLFKNEFISQQRDQFFVRPRQVAMYLAKKLTKRSFPVIGRQIANRDHSTVIHGVKRIKALILEDDQVREEVEHIEKKVMDMFRATQPAEAASQELKEIGHE